jgi:transposase
VVERDRPERGFVPLHRRVAERGFARAARCRRPARDDERLPETLAGFHFAAFPGLMPKHAALAEGP